MNGILKFRLDYVQLKHMIYRLFLSKGSRQVLFAEHVLKEKHLTIQYRHPRNKSHYLLLGEKKKFY